MSRNPISCRALTWALVEIRATDNIEKARGLADIFHNVPTMLLRDASDDEILQEIRARAKRFKASPLIESYIKAACGKVCDQFEAPPHQHLLDENTALLQRLAEGGTDLQRKREIDFSVALPDKPTCEAFRAALRARGDLPPEAMFIIANYDEGPELILSVKMRPTAEAITKVELTLRTEGRAFAAGEVSWEFAE